MTATEIAFILSLSNAFITYCNQEATLIKLGEPDYKGLRKIKLSLLSAMIEMIEHWFRDTVTGDDNFCEPDDIQTSINMANDIMDSHCYIDLSGY